MSPLIGEQARFLQDVALLVQYANRLGFVVTGGELWRTAEQQEIYMKQGKSLTNSSNHLRRCAIDLNFFHDGKLTYDISLLTPIGVFWESLDTKNSAGMFWKTFRDVPHFERRP